MIIKFHDVSKILMSGIRKIMSKLALSEMVFWLQIFADKNTYNTREFAIIQIILANIIALVADTTSHRRNI